VSDEEETEVLGIFLRPFFKKFCFSDGTQIAPIRMYRNIRVNKKYLAK